MSIVNSYFFSVLGTMILYINRTVDIVLPVTLAYKDIHVREIIDDFRSQYKTFNETFEAFVQMAPGRFCITAKSACKLEAVEHSDFLVCGYCIQFQPVSTAKWVNVTGFRMQSCTRRSLKFYLLMGKSTFLNRSSTPVFIRECVTY